MVCELDFNKTYFLKAKKKSFHFRITVFGKYQASVHTTFQRNGGGEFTYSKDFIKCQELC